MRALKHSLSVRDWIAALIGCAVILTYCYNHRERALEGINDFAQLYAGGKLALTGQLYSRDANLRVIGDTLGVTLDGVLYSRLPFYALLLKPLSMLPYRVAYLIFVSLNIGALAWFLTVFRRAVPELTIFVALSLPAIVALMTGQDALIVLGLATGCIVLARKGRDFQSGLLLSLCAIKFHLFVLPAIAVMVTRRWGIFRGAVCGGAVLLAFSFIAGGLNWPMEYLARVGSPELHPGAEHMPTLSAIAELLPAWRHFVLGFGTICGVSIFLLAAAKVKDFEVLFGISLVGGLLLSFHAYLQDCVVLLLAFAIIISRSANKPLRGVMAIATTPPPCLLLLMGTPTSAIFPIILFGILVLAAFERPVSVQEPAPEQPGKQAVAAR